MNVETCLGIYVHGVSAREFSIKYPEEFQERRRKGRKQQIGQRGKSLKRKVHYSISDGHDARASAKVNATGSWVHVR